MVDIGGSILATLVLAVVYGIILGATGASQEEIEAITTRVPTDSWFFYASTLVGCAFSVLGGYACARIAKQSAYRLGAILAAISVLIGLLLTFSQYSLMMSAGFAIAGAAAVMLGVRWGYARNHR